MRHIYLKRLTSYEIVFFIWRYIADAWQDKLDSLPDVGKNEINVVNQEIVSRLKSTDTAFSLGESLDLVKYGHEVIDGRPSKLFVLSDTINEATEWVQVTGLPVLNLLWVGFPLWAGLLGLLLSICFEHYSNKDTN